MGNTDELTSTVTWNTNSFTFGYRNVIKRGGWVFIAFAATALATGTYEPAVTGLPRCATSSYYGCGSGDTMYTIDNVGTPLKGRIRINRGNTSQQFFNIVYPQYEDEY